MYKYNSETYFEFGYEPNMKMVLSGWEWEIKTYLFNTISIIWYYKKMIRNGTK